MSHKTLNNVFNIEPDVKTSECELITSSGEVIVPNNRVEENLDYDYNKARSNLHGLLEQGQNALYHALEVAKSSEHPRAFEVVGNLVKQLADINGQLIDLTSKRQKALDKEAPVEKQNVTTNNAIFVGSTADLNKMIKDLTRG